MQPVRTVHTEWSSRLTFVLAATGSAVGLGNIWRFPYLAGENGGGAFVLVYLLCVGVVGLPIMVAEILIGRRGRSNPMDAMAALAQESHASPHWRWVGLVGVVTGALILSFYSVVGGWTLTYLDHAVRGELANLDAAGAQALLAGLFADPWSLLGWHSVFMAAVLVVSARGVEGGLDRAAQVLMPGLLIMLLALVGYGTVSGHFGDAARFMFTPDFSRLNGQTVLLAMGQAFFSLSLGMGAIMIYGSYLGAGASIARLSLTVIAADTAVAVLAGLAVFPVVFANALSPGQGPGLVFVTLPLGFMQMPGGAVFAAVFFAMLAVAAWTSAISLLEPAVAWLSERHGLGRRTAVWTAGGVTWALGIVSVLSLNVWSGHRVAGRTAFDLLDYVTNNLLLPLGGMAVALFAGWALDRAVTAAEVGVGSGPYRVWRVLVRYVAPLAVGAVLVGELAGTG